MFSGGIPSRRPQGERLTHNVSRPGVINPSNTCYMSSTLQCLATLDSLHDLITHADPASDHATAPFSSPSLQALLGGSLDGIPITGALVNVLRKLYNQKGGTVDPKHLLKRIGKRNPDYASIDEQQDAQEAFSYLTACLWEEEMDLIKAVRPPAPKPEKKERKRRKRSTITPGNASSSSAGDTSESSSSSSSSDEESPTATPEMSPEPSSEPVLRPFVDTLFGGKLASIIVCEECKHVSVTREPFQDLPVEMDKDEKPRRRDRIRQFLSKNAEPSSPVPSSPDTSKRPPMMSRQSSTFGSVSETDGSASEADGEAASISQKKASDLNRRRSLDPGALRARKSIFSRSRDPSPVRKLSKRGLTVTPSMPRPSPEQAAYIKRLLADIPGAAATPLPNIRIAQPDGKAKVVSPGSDYGKKKEDRHHHHLSMFHRHDEDKHEATDDKVLEAQMSTGLYEALRRFTNVEILEGENALQCRNCWKLMNPTLVKARKSRRATLKAGGVRPFPTASPVLENGSDAEDDADEQMRTRPLLRSPNATEVGPDLATRARVLSLTSEISQITSSSSDSSVYSTARRDVPVISSELVGGEAAARLGPVDASDSSVASGSEGGADDSVDGDASSRSTAPTSTLQESDRLAPVKREVSLASSTISAASAPTVLTPMTALDPILPRAVPIPPKKERYILRRAHKRLLIDALPRVLVVHLKRFQQSSRQAMFGSGFRDLKKIDTFVSFPLELDLAPFLAPKGKPPNATKAGRPPHLRASSNSSNHHAWFHWHHHRNGKEGAAATALGTRYRLVGLISHSGSMSSGHYIAFVRKAEDNTWLWCSDESVRAASVEEVLASKCYTLWYERRD